MIKINPGDRFGRLVVIRETTKDERVNQAGRNYLCKCDCGNEVIIYGHNLKTGNTKSCGCLSRETASKNNTKDIPIGTQYGHLTVIERAPKHDNGLAYWICQCDCGNIVEVSGRDLRSGKVTSCECKKYNPIDETGKRYGKLLVLKRVKNDKDTHSGAIWLCQCDCGNIVEVRGDQLRAGQRSCGCVKSYKEMEIEQFLQQNQVEYAREFTFPDLKSKKNYPLRFDFAIFKDHVLKCLIEYQGTQHFDQNCSWYSEDYVERDNTKKQYCQDKHIPLYCYDKNTNLYDALKEVIAT